MTDPGTTINRRGDINMFYAPQRRPDGSWGMALNRQYLRVCAVRNLYEIRRCITKDMAIKLLNEKVPGRIGAAIVETWSEPTNCRRIT